MLRIRRTLCDASDPFNLTEHEFRSFHRLSREAVRTLIEDLRPLLPNPRRRHGIRIELQVLIAMNFIASGSYQSRVGQNYLACVSQPTVSKILSNVVDALNTLMQEYIQFPIEDAELQHVKEIFWAHARFPGVIGAIDDYEGKIFTVNAASGGRTHDARVWRASQVSSHLQDMCLAGRRNAWLLGDSAYPLLPYLMTPKLNAPEGTQSAAYTQYHIRARSCVERCIGAVKGRWGCLRKERALHYAPATAARIVNAACVLYNIALRWRLPVPDSFYDEIDEELAAVNVNVEVEKMGTRPVIGSSIHIFRIPKLPEEKCKQLNNRRIFVHLRIFI